MPTFGIDVNPATREQKTGTEWYTVNLIEAMQKQLLPEEQVFFYSRDTLHWPFKRFWTQLRLSWEMFRRPPDVLFVPAHALPRIHPKATVTTVHDVGFKCYPQLYESKARRYLESTTKLAVKQASALLVPSAFTKQELVEHYGADSQKITITPLAPDHQRFAHVSAEEIERVRRTYRLSSHLFVTVSRMESKKNIATLVKAFEFFKEHRGVGDPFQLVLIGKPGFGYQTIKALIDRSPFTVAIHELGWVPDQDIAPLMASATAYVYPSWYEGLGISALEALAAGVPLIASDIPALHEAAADAALYFNPSVPEELASAMTRLADDPSLCQGLVQKGKEHVQQFSWDKTAEITWRVLREVAGSK